MEYEKWLHDNESELMTKYEKHMEENYTWVEPDTYVSFEDFCLGHWQTR